MQTENEECKLEMNKCKNMNRQNTYLSREEFITQNSFELCVAFAKKAFKKAQGENKPSSEILNTNRCCDGLQRCCTKDFTIHLVNSKVPPAYMGLAPGRLTPQSLLKGGS